MTDGPVGATACYRVSSWWAWGPCAMYGSPSGTFWALKDRPALSARAPLIGIRETLWGPACLRAKPAEGTSR